MSDKKGKVILFNGAPNSGKDTSAEMMKEICGFGKIHAFKDILYKETAKHFGIDLDKFIAMAQNRKTKDVRTNELVNKSSMTWFEMIKFFILSFFMTMGISPREALIHVSEKVIKPKFGKTYYGKKLVEVLNRYVDKSLFFISDSGFLDEIVPLVEAGYEVIVIRVHRDGCTFAGDSRSELTDEMLDGLGLKGIDVQNNGTLDDLKDELLQVAAEKIKW